jgi:S1-C subfamily serine protease
MNAFDLAIVAVMVLAAIGGYRVGLLARLAGWGGWVFGIVVAAAVAPLVLDQIGGLDPQVRLLLAIGVFLAIASIGAAIGEVLGLRLRRMLPTGVLRQADHAGGALAGAVGVLLLLWLLLPALADIPGEISAQVRNSTIARTVESSAPRAPKPLQDLRQAVVDANFPEVFSGLRPAPDTGPPPGESVLPPAVRARVGASTVRLSGRACSRILSGSGFTVASETVVTNAHVVAGVDRPTVIRPDGRQLNATVQVFDPNRDLAVLRVPGLGEAALEIGKAGAGTEGAVFGYPGGQRELAISPARIESQVNALGRDLYGTATTRREVFILAASVHPGDSGGALTDADGVVVGVAFAIAPDRPSTAYALTSDELNAALAAPRGGAVDTGPCLR